MSSSPYSSRGLRKSPIDDRGSSVRNALINRAAPQKPSITEEAANLRAANLRSELANKSTSEKQTREAANLKAAHERHVRKTANLKASDLGRDVIEQRRIETRRKARNKALLIKAEQFKNSQSNM